MTLTILTACKGKDWEPLRSIVEPNLWEYADRWGYRFGILEGTYHDETWAVPMDKTKWVRDSLAQSSSDYFWILDLDLLVTNMTIPVRQFLDDTHTIFMARDISGHLNCGSYLLRNNEKALRWLDSILSLRTCTTSEQDAIIRLSKAPLWKSITKELPQNTINSMPYDLYDTIGRKTHEEGQWENGDLLVHLPGMTPQRRYEILKDYSNWVIR